MWSCIELLQLITCPLFSLDAIEKLDGTEFGTKQRKLKVQWAKMTEADRKRDGLKPSNTLVGASLLLFIAPI